MVEVDNQIAAPVMNGLVANRLFAEHSYKIITKAKSALIGTGTRGNEKLFIRVVTDPKPFVGDGWNSFAKSWCYNWEKSFWEETDSSQRDQWHAIEVSSIGVNTDEAIFHTFNHRTPLRYDARSYLGSMEGYFTSAGPVHDSNTIYYIEIAKPLNTGAMRGVTLLSTEMVDMNYNPYLQDYTQKDVEDIFNWFDNKLSRGNISRDSRDSSGTFCTSGGSRSEYLEWFGGSNSALDGVYGFIDK
jgi:hypothetical protein